MRFVEDDWESPTLGAWGLGWEVWLNGMEITQFTYFQQVGGLDCKPVLGEITYGLERLAMYLQGKDSVYDLVWVDGVTYRDVYHQNEVEQSKYNFELANVDMAVPALRRLRRRSEAPRSRRSLRAARLRDGAEGLAHLQPARCARRDLGHRARGLHRPRARTARGSSRRPTTSRAKRSAFRCARAQAGMSAETLLVELLTEELPPKALRAARACVRRRASRRARARRPGAEEQRRAGSRRRGGSPCSSRSVRERAPDAPVEAQGPSVKSALDAQGSPRRRWPASRGRTASRSRRSSSATRRKGRGVRLPRVEAGGAALDEVLAGEGRRAALQALPIPKVMRWGDGDAQFVRPVHGLVMLHGSRVVPGAVLGLRAGNTTLGHRFLSTGAITLARRGRLRARAARRRAA